MFYNSIMSRAPSFGGIGLGHSEARYWHKRIYSGLVSTPPPFPLTSNRGDHT